MHLFGQYKIAQLLLIISTKNIYAFEIKRKKLDINRRAQWDLKVIIYIELVLAVSSSLLINLCFAQLEPDFSFNSASFFELYETRKLRLECKLSISSIEYTFTIYKIILSDEQFDFTWTDGAHKTEHRMQ